MLAERFTPLRAALALLLGLAGAVTGVAIAAPAATSVGPDGTVALTVVVPLAVPESDAGFIPADALDQYTRPTGLLTRELDAIIDRPVVIAIDPRIIASIRILGSSAPASAIEWLSRLESASNETFALTYADSDITLGLQAGSPRVLQPESFDFAIEPSLFAEPAAQTPAPTPSPDATAPGLPTSESLLAWPYTLESIAWPRDGTVVAADLPAITASGYTTTILSSANVSRDEGSALVRVDGGTAAISDDAVSGALRTAVASVSPEDWVSAMATVGSALDAAPATVLATLDRTVPITGTHLAETLTTLQADPRVRLTGLSQLLAGSPDEANLVDSPHPAGSVERKIATPSIEHATRTAENRDFVRVHLARKLRYWRERYNRGSLGVESEPHASTAEPGTPMSAFFALSCLGDPDFLAGRSHGVSALPVQLPLPCGGAASGVVR